MPFGKVKVTLCPVVAVTVIGPDVVTPVMFTYHTWPIGRFVSVNVAVQGPEPVALAMPEKAARPENTIAITTTATKTLVFLFCIYTRSLYARKSRERTTDEA